MPTYAITQEFHTTPAVPFKGRPGHSTDFFYAVRREDGSLVYRAETQAYAELLLARLDVFTRDES